MTQQVDHRLAGVVVTALAIVASLLVGAAPSSAQSADEANLTELMRISDASSSLIHEESQTLIYIANDEVFLQTLDGDPAQRIGAGNRIDLSPDQRTLLVADAPSVFDFDIPASFTFHDPVTGAVRGTSSGQFLQRRWTSDSKYFFAEPATGEPAVLIEAATGQIVDLPAPPSEAVQSGYFTLPASLPDGGALVVRWIDPAPGEWVYRAASLVEGNESAVVECGADFVAFAVVRDRLLCHFDGPNGPDAERPRATQIVSATIGSGLVTDLGDGFVNSNTVNSDYSEIEPGRWLLTTDGSAKSQNGTDLNGYDYEANALFTLSGPALPATVDIGAVRVTSLGDGLFTRTIEHVLGEAAIEVDTSVMRLDGSVIAQDFNGLEFRENAIIGLAVDGGDRISAAFDFATGSVVQLDDDESFAFVSPHRRGITPGNGLVIQGPYGGFEELGFRSTARADTLPIQITDPMGVPDNGFRQVILENFSGDTLVIKEVRTCSAGEIETSPALSCGDGYERRLIVYSVAEDTVRSAGPAEDQILRLYRAVFGRSPDAGGFAFWNDSYRSGSSLEAIAAQFRAAPEFTDRYGASPSDADLLDALYANILDRPGDGGGVAFWLDRLENGMTVPALLVAFAESPENIERTGTRPPITAGQGQILRLYQAAFGRVPDADGWAFWTAELSSGVDPVVIAAGFAGSPEFDDRYGDAPTNQELVDAMYVNVLGRPGDSSGVEFWLDRLDDDLTVPEMLVAFAQSPENVVRTGTR